ncbi:hypothetical protein [Enterococcus hirae]|uniref:hypothetical protein n=1 Tax=Enterococcus hirae TaxID=1354 RepID=UPI001F625174|nr:hypothetical protein [Enterococcus hirae]
MDLREEKKAQELLLAEKESVRALKNTFVNIAEVKIEKTVQGPWYSSGYTMFATITNIKGQSVSFDYSFDSLDYKIDKIDSYGIEDRSVQVKGVTTTKVKVIYSNGKEDYV